MLFSKKRKKKEDNVYWLDFGSISPTFESIILRLILLLEHLQSLLGGSQGSSVERVYLSFSWKPKSSLLENSLETRARHDDEISGFKKILLWVHRGRGEDSSSWRGVGELDGSGFG